MTELAHPPAAGAGRRWLALVVVLVAAFMDLLDVNIVNVALPSLQRDLGVDYAADQLVTAGYTLAFGVVLITGGRLGDIYGHKRMFQLGTAGFAIASLLCAVSGSPEMLVGARLFQGAMAAVMVPQVLAIIHVTFSPAELGKVVGLYAVIGGLAVVAGPLLGGVLVSWNPFGLEWRSIFLVNVPVGIAAAVLGMIFIGESRSPHPPRLDPVGVLLATLGILLLLYPLVRGRELGWPAWTIVAMIAALPVFALFVLHQRRRTRRGAGTLIALTLFRSRGFTAGVVVQLLFQAVPAAFFLAWTLYLQFGLGWSPLHTGLMSLPFSVGVSISGGLSMQVLFPRFGRASLMAGAVLMAVGAVWYALLAGQSDGVPASWPMIFPLLLFGLGMGQVVAPLVGLALTDVPPQDAGAAAGMISATAQLGSALGVALIGVVLFGAVGTQLQQATDQAVPSVSRQLAAAGVASADQGALLSQFRDCVGAGALDSAPAAACAGPATAPAGDVLAAEAGQVKATGFGGAFRESQWYLAGTLVLVLLVMFALPRRPAPPLPPVGAEVPAAEPPVPAD